MRMLTWEVNKDEYGERDEDMDEDDYENEDKVVHEGEDQDERMDA